MERSKETEVDNYHLIFRVANAHHYQPYYRISSNNFLRK